jgi:hypothetical protein
MFEARKPENWQWLWAGHSQSGDAEIAEPQLDTRLQQQNGQDAPGTIYAPFQNPPPRSDDVLEQVQQHAWSMAMARLDRAERAALDSVLRGTYRRNSELAGADEDWESALAKLSTACEEYFNSARSALMARPEDERVAWSELLRRTEVRWRQEWLPALQAAGGDQAKAAAEYEAIQAMQAAVDQFLLGQIEDDTVFRSAEHPVWFRWFEKLQQAPAEEIRRQSLGSVSFVQLFRQPDQYRGKIVTIRGSARLAYRVPAPENTSNIENYYVFWLKPAGGQLSPYIVYCLELPDGFPQIRDKYRDGNTTSLAEEVEFDGYFFKRQVYRAQDGVNTAPVLLAKSPRWFPTAPVGSRRGSLPLFWTIVSVAAVLLLSIVLAAIAYAPYRIRARPADGTLAKNLEELRERELAIPVAEALQQMANRKHEKANGSQG